MRIVAYVLIGLGIGGVSGMLGIGGGVLLVPLLIWVFGFEHTKAVGTTLAVLVPPIGLPAALKYYSEDRMDLEAAFWLALAFAVGGFVGAALVHQVPDRLLRQLFGLFMVYIGARFLLSSSSEAGNMTAGLVAVAGSWLAFLWLRRRGQMHLARPNVGDEVRRMGQLRRGEPDYTI